jgi:hypothetical protein
MPADLSSAGSGRSIAAPRASAAEAREFAELMSPGRGPIPLDKVVGRGLQDMSGRYATLNREWMNFRVDLKDPAAMVMIAEQQARVTAANLHLQFALHTAEATRGSLQKLLQQQG